jgi:hypothetical protein
MKLPFKINQFMEVFAQYNQTVWPAQVIANLLALLALFMLSRGTRRADQTINGILAGLWFWMGLVYHIGFFSPINKAAYGFGILFILQGFIFLFSGVFKSKITYRFRLDAYSGLGGLFILYGLVIYPILGFFLGHRYPQAPTFGVPCPSTIFTFGILLWTTGKLPKYVLAIPFIWSIIGFTAALTLGILEDIGLLVAGLTGTGAIFIKDRINGEELGISR